MVDYTRNSSEDIALSSPISTLFTGTRILTSNMPLYNNSGNDTTLAVGGITNDTFELAYAKYQTFTLPQGGYKVAYGRGIWIAVKYDNMNMHDIALKSTDGINWTDITLPTTEHWIDIAYGNGRFVIISQLNNSQGGNYFLYSADGNTWTSVASPEQNTWSTIVFGENRFVVICDNKSTYSFDGTSWSTAVTTSNVGPRFYGLAYGNSTWVALSMHIYANTLGAVYSADNGVSWTAGSGNGPGMLSSSIIAAAYANDTYVGITGDNYIRRWDLTGTIKGSSGYINESLSLRPYMNLCAVDGVFYNISNNYFARSTDAINWIIEDTNLTLPDITCICPDNTGHLVATSRTGTGLYITFANKPTNYYCWKLDMINLYDGSGSGYEYVFTASSDPKLGDTIYLPISYSTGIDVTQKVIHRVSSWGSDATIVDGFFITSASHRSGYARYSQGDTTDIPTMMVTLCGSSQWINQDVTCLTGDTLVTMYDRSTKRLDEIETDDKVLSINTDTGEYIEDEVIFTDKDKNKSYLSYDLWKFSNNYQVKTVHRHRFYNIEDNCFVYMDRWNIGDHTINEKGEMLELLSHETIQEEVKHYKITTKKYHNYFANGMLTGSRLTKAFDYKDLKIGEK